MIVARKFIAPSSEEVMMKTIANSHCVWPVQKIHGSAASFTAASGE